MDRRPEYRALPIHGFNGGNKGTAWVAAKVFCKLNGYNLKASEPEAVALMNSVAEGELPEDRLTLWINERLSRQ